MQAVPCEEREVIMAKYEEKFIVINTKFLKILNKKRPAKYKGQTVKNMVVCNFITALQWLNDTLMGCEIDMSKKKYYVCNQDEPYAQQVIDIILNGEGVKEIEAKYNKKKN